MKKSELYEMASAITIDVLKRNKDLTNERVREMFIRPEEDERLSINDTIGRAIVLALTLAPEISAAITAAMLVELGLVTLEDDE